jgi:membrane-associated protease RseP (regulator of RpoE activity)
MPDDPAGGPPAPGDLAPAVHVTEVQETDQGVRYVGDPLVPPGQIRARLEPQFQDAGYALRISEEGGRLILLAQPLGVQGVPWTNLALFVATVLSTLFVGAVGWYYVPPGAIADNPLRLLDAWPFSAAVLGVLGVHELGHYVMGRKYRVPISLPYFIPVPTIVGTMGAVIRMRGRMPDRRALFDIGVAGPLAGLAATIVVTAIGLTLDPIEVPQRVLDTSTQGIELAEPPLLQLIAVALGEPIGYSEPGLATNPVVIGGWVGMFVTFLNLIPVGQLDGGHMVRAMVGRGADTLSAFVPGALFAMAGYLHYVRGLGLRDSVLLWMVWGGFATLLAFGGSAEPTAEGDLDARRQAIGLLTFGLGLLCFTPVPFRVVAAG